MATTTFVAAPTFSAPSTFYTVCHPIAAFMATAGWTQNGDTGQIVWPASIFNITDANGNGSTVTFTGTITNGAAALRVGQQIKVSGTTNFGTTGAPIVYTVTGGNLTTTWTAASATSAHDSAIAALTGWGMVYVLPTMTAVTGNGTTATYTYSDTDGLLKPGMSVVIPQTGTTGFTNTGFNGTFTVLTANGSSFTVTNGTNASETKTVTGQVATATGVIAASASGTSTMPPAASNQLYEVWKMADGNALPIYLKIGYGGNTNASTDAALHVTISTSTDGAGNPTGGSSGQIVAFRENTTSASNFNCYLAGSTNRIHIAMFTNCTAATIGGCLVSVERAHDASGNDLATYATLTVVGTGNSGAIVVNQNSITSTGVTTSETRLATVTVHSTGTGSFGGSTILSPVFPLVGAIGNPTVGVLVGKAADWVDATQFPFTMYNTSRNYIVFNTAATTWIAAGALVYDSTATCCAIMRYE